ncbi:exosome complex RNA-binding protein Csl4 [Candidatus Bathyarchaeota archaeon]|nr:exosome complex RNA-binding protein Csl4 [Candidatus Bathyarchaeota archaeon]MBS7627384.1 exosome complex RNA-binding protein Csl4 [Candidatus Bathyarchaeota archaeon]
MVSMKEKSERLVLPGDRLGVVEEFSPGHGAFEIDGTVFSSFAGLTYLDLKSRVINIKPLSRKVLMPKVGDLAICEVISTSEKHVTTQIIRGSGRFFNIPFTGVIHLKTIGVRYLKSLYEAYKPRDIVLAQIIGMKNGFYHLSTQGMELGALLSYCSQCGSNLKREGAFMQCKNCGNVEKRKFSIFYGRSDIDYDRLRVRLLSRRRV